MGRNKEKQSSQTTTQFTASPEERAFLAQLTADLDATRSGRIGAQNLGLQRAQDILSGGTLPGFLAGLPGGISPELTSEIAGQAVEDIRPGFQSAGIIDSGVAAEIAARTAGDVRRQSAQFNINNLMKLLSLGFGNAVVQQQPALQTQQQLGTSLAGLRTQSTTGNTVTTGMNPFLKSFQTGLGSSLGKSFGTVNPFAGGKGTLSKIFPGGGGK